MKKLLPLNVENAPEASKESLRNVQKGFGFIPNLMGTFANAPAVLNGYLAMSAAWDKSSLTPKERQLIVLAVSTQNHCNYCQAAHATILKGIMKVDADLVAAVREGRELADNKLNALVNFTKEIVSERGYVSEKTKENFLVHGYNETQMMEVIVGIAIKTVSNYIDHINPVEIDKEFSSEA